MIGVFTDTIIICSASAMILLLAGPVPHWNAGIQLLQQALVNLTGGWGRICLARPGAVCLQFDCGELPLRRK
jgi:Na+/alanine symporter